MSCGTFKVIMLTIKLNFDYLHMVLYIHCSSFPMKKSSVNIPAIYIRDCNQIPKYPYIGVKIYLHTHTRIYPLNFPLEHYF